MSLPGPAHLRLPAVCLLLSCVAVWLFAPAVTARADLRVDTAEEAPERMLERRRDVEREQERKLEEFDRLYAETAGGFTEEHFPWALLVLFLVALSITYVIITVRERARAQPEMVVLTGVPPRRRPHRHAGADAARPPYHPRRHREASALRSLLGLISPSRRRRRRRHRHHPHRSHRSHHSHRHSS